MARWRPAAGPAWLRWLTRPVLEVYETEDESLVFAVHFTWKWAGRWTVEDADGHYVGLLWRFRAGWLRRRGFESPGRRLRGDGMLIEEKLGRLSAVLVPPAGGNPGRFLDAGGEALADFHREQGGVRLTFADLLDGDPFARMLLLAALLVWVE
jgi:hypothetical protein